MAYTLIGPVHTKDATKTSFANAVRLNLDDHESRIGQNAADIAAMGAAPSSSDIKSWAISWPKQPENGRVWTPSGNYRLGTFTWSENVKRLSITGGIQGTEYNRHGSFNWTFDCTNSKWTGAWITESNDQDRNYSWHENGTTASNMRLTNWGFDSHVDWQVYANVNISNRTIEIRSNCGSYLQCCFVSIHELPY